MALSNQIKFTKLHQARSTTEKTTTTTTLCAGNKSHPQSSQRCEETAGEAPAPRSPADTGPHLFRASLNGVHTPSVKITATAAAAACQETCWAWGTAGSVIAAADGSESCWLPVLRSPPAHTADRTTQLFHPTISRYFYIQLYSLGGSSGGRQDSPSFFAKDYGHRNAGSPSEPFCNVALMSFP